MSTAECYMSPCVRFFVWNELCSEQRTLIWKGDTAFWLYMKDCIYKRPACMCFFVAKVPKWDVNNHVDCGMSINSLVEYDVRRRPRHSAPSAVGRPSHGMMNECSEEVLRHRWHPYFADSDIFTCNVSIWLRFYIIYLTWVWRHYFKSRVWIRIFGKL